MSKRPTGTSLDEDRLLELREAHDGAESTYAVEVTDLVDRTALPSDALVDWSVDERDGTPMLVFGPLEEDGVADAPYPRRLYENDGTTFVPVPDRLLAVDPPDGLGLSLESAADPPILFEAVATDETVGLLPARYADGTPYAREPLPESPSRSDPVAEGSLEHERDDADPTPRPETVDAPIDPDLLADAAAEGDASLAALADVLEEVARLGVVGEGDTVPDYPPFAVDDRAVCIVDADTWEETIGPRLEVEKRTVLEAAAAVHERQAERLIDASGAGKYQGFEEEYAAVVTDERDTAEWDVSLAGRERSLEDQGH